MRYTVLWSPDAENDRARIWLAAADRAGATAAGYQIDTLLREDAHLHGESREGRFRIVFVLPLAIDFEVIEEGRLPAALAL